MKYSLMSLMLDSELKLTRPNFIHMAMLNSMGYKGENPTIDEVFQFLNDHGIPAKNGTMTFEDLVRCAKENGYDAVDMMSFHFETEGKEAKEILDKYGMKMSAVDLIMPFANCTTEEKYELMLSRAKSAIDQTADAGCETLMLMPTVYALDGGITFEQGYQNMIRGLRACVAYANGRGVTVSTETLESVGVPYCTIGEMKRVFADVPELRYTHDTGNPLVGCEDPITTYETFRDRVRTVHFKEYGDVDRGDAKLCRNGRKVDSVPFGEGVIDFRKHLELLHRDNYDGYIVIEGSVAADDRLDGVKKSIDYFRGMEAEVLA